MAAARNWRSPHPGVGLPAVAEKFLGRGRGGYCYEHTTLLAAVLERLGYRVSRRLARVGNPQASPRSHLTAIVDLDGERLLVDAGFGFTPKEPIPLVAGTQPTAGGWEYRVEHEDGPAGAAWILHRRTHDGWQLLHATDEQPVLPSDVEVAHHFTSTHPASHFTQGLSLMKHLPDRHVALADGRVTTRSPGRPTEQHELGDGELVQLVELLRPGLTGVEIDSLVSRFG